MDIVLETKKGKKISFCSLCIQDKKMCEKCQEEYVEGGIPNSFIPMSAIESEMKTLKEGLMYRNNVEKKLTHINSIVDFFRKEAVNDKKPDVPLKELGYTPLNFFVHLPRKVCCISNKPYTYYGEDNTVADKLEIGKFYTIKNIRNFSWMSMIEFEEIPNDMFNSLHFRELEEGEE